MKSILLWLELQNKLIFFCLKISRYIQSSAFLYHWQLFWLTIIIMPPSRHCLFEKILISSVVAIFLVQFEVIVRSKTSQLYHTAERMVWFKCWTCSLNAYSLESLLSFQAKHGGGITAVQTWVALKISDCIVWASAACTGAYSRRLCGIKF